MKKLTLLCMASDKDAALKELGRLGVLHISAVNPPEGRDLEAARARLAGIERVLAAFPETKEAERGGRADAGAVVEKAGTLINRRKQLAGDIEQIKLYADKIEPLGDFEPASVSALKNSGVHAGLYHAPLKTGLSAPEGTALKILSRTKSSVYFAVFGMADEPTEVPEHWTEIELPELSLTLARKRLREKARELESVEAGLLSLAAHRNSVDRLRARVRMEIEFQSARAGMGAAGPIAYLQGFCPGHDVERVRTGSAREGWGMLIEEPGAGDKVPTLLRHPGWVKPVKTIFEMINILPGYREVDISAAFLLFFSLFFAMIIGDAGYGLLFLLITILARRKMPDAPGYAFTMFGILSVSTIIWGVLTGNYFGIVSVPGPLKTLSIGWLDDTTNLMKLCFLIGAIHLTLAHAWNAIRYMNSLRAVAQVGWILMTWTMFLAARHFVCGETFPVPGGLILGGAGLAGIILFMTPVDRLKSEFIHHAMLPLTVINNFVDVVSYVRLFAVGMASVQVAQSFNNMAMGLGVGRVWTVPAVALILLGGHALNIVLCALGVLVHGVRLNTLEFSNHVGLEWAGVKYEPFRAGQVKVDA